MKYVKNLLKYYRKATMEDIDKGLDWYQVAHNIAKELSEKHNISLKTVCGIMSALSPSVSWERNIIETVEFLQSNGNSVCSTYRINVEKAKRILNGSSPESEFCKNTGSFKTWNFYNNILSPNSPDYVTIDRHMISAIDYDKPFTTRKRYYELVEIIKTVSKKLGLVPNQLQAVVWECYKTEFDIRNNIEVSF